MVAARTQALRHLLLRRVALSVNPTPHLETARSPLSSPSLATLSPSPLPFSSSHPSATELAAAARLTTVPPSPLTVLGSSATSSLFLLAEPRDEENPEATPAKKISNHGRPRSPLSSRRPRPSPSTLTFPTSPL